MLGDALGVDLAFDQYTRARLAFRNKVTRVIRKIESFVKCDPLSISPLSSARGAQLWAHRAWGRVRARGDARAVPAVGAARAAGGT